MMREQFGELSGPLSMPERSVLEGSGPVGSLPVGSGPVETEAKKALILLHGWGADGRDLIDLAGPLQQSLPDCALWCPDAPDLCSANPMGRQWFELTQDFFQNPETALQEIAAIAQKIEQAICDFAAHHSLSLTDIVVGGFSQGGMMSLHMAVSGRLPVFGFASLSGALIAPQKSQASSDTARPAIFLAHGMRDEVVPFQASQQAKSHLEAAGHVVHFVTRPELGHGIDGPALDGLISFIKTG
ncbi:MAG: alpha/beta hydrolase [Candidatus Puniceispirillaceae bacterium]